MCLRWIGLKKTIEGMGKEARNYEGISLEDLNEVVWDDIRLQRPSRTWRRGSHRVVCSAMRGGAEGRGALWSGEVCSGSGICVNGSGIVTT